MQITVIRKPSGKNYMLSACYVDGRYQCVVIELPALPPVPGGLHAIPAGTYAVRTTYSNKFSALNGKPTCLPQLFDLPGHSTRLGTRPLNECGIRLHSGNVVNGIPQGQPGGPRPGPYNVNDPLRTDSHMCLLPGTGVGPDGHSVINSRAAFGALNALILAAEKNHEAIKITIR